MCLRAKVKSSTMRPRPSRKSDSVSCKLDRILLTYAFTDLTQLRPRHCQPVPGRTRRPKAFRSRQGSCLRRVWPSRLPHGYLGKARTMQDVRPTTSGLQWTLRPREACTAGLPCRILQKSRTNPTEHLQGTHHDGVRIRPGTNFGRIVLASSSPKSIVEDFWLQSVELRERV